MKAANLNILFEDDYYVAVYKPAGLMVHRSRLKRTGRFLLQQLRDRIRRPTFPVHRLDKPTSGVILFALSSEAAHLLASAFARKAVRKTYLAVVRGFMPEEGAVDQPLTRTIYRRKNEKTLRPALTRFRRLATAEVPVAVSRYATSRYSLIEAFPLTGRMHQIRRHLRHIAHPVIGDHRYGDNRHNRFFQTRLDCPRLLLTALELSFTHPYTGADITICAGIDDSFGSVIRKLKWQQAIPENRCRPWTSVDTGG